MIDLVTCQCTIYGYCRQSNKPFNVSEINIIYFIITFISNENLYFILSLKILINLAMVALKNLTSKSIFSSASVNMYYTMYFIHF